MSPVARILVLALVVGAIAGCGSPGEGEPALTVGAATSLRTALTDYEASGAAGAGPVRTTFGGSDLLASQIRQGAGIDVIAAASSAEPDALFREGLVGKPVKFAGNRMVIAVPDGSDIDSIDDLAEPGLTLIIGAGSVPVGEYAREILGHLSPATEQGVMDNVKSEEPDASSIAAKLVQGAADAGMLYATDVHGASADIKAIPIPAKLQPLITYSAAVSSKADDPVAAHSYIQGLLSGAGVEVLERAGFKGPP